MNCIRVLPDQVANQIAAGEVVERPASVLKELVENSIDARATQIRIEIRGSGKSLIRVTDDGYGMSRDDALLCLERHATSKIHESADIGSIHTLGFRGEAIPSIASISRFRILTREISSPIGTEIDVHGGKLLTVKEAGCAIGCQVEVRNLFYNLPARRKFLRSDITEMGHLHHVFLLQAMAQPRMAWTFQQDDRILHQLETCAPELKLHDALLSRIRALYGPQIASQLLPVDFAREGIRIQGFTGKPGFSRSNRSELHCFVNTRPVDSRAVYYGLIEGYHTALMRGRYPVCFLFLEVDPSSVDVNIHPAKREVRFREDARVQGTVVEAIRKAIGTSIGVPRSIDPIGIHFPEKAATPHPFPTSSNLQSSSLSPTSMATSRSHVPAAFRLTPSASSTSEIPAIPLPNLTNDSHSDSSSAAVLGVFANLYVVAMDAQGLMIVDQHAAHERILFEQMMSRLSKGEAPSQKLLMPQTIELSPRDAVTLKQHLVLFEKMGFGLAEFGATSFILDAVPTLVCEDNLQTLLRLVLDELSQAGGGINRDRFAEELVAKTVCRHAVKANDILRREELDQLLTDLFACVHPLTCPHGRPTVLRITQPELERKFGRRSLENV